MMNRETYIAAMKVQLDELNAKMDSLEESAKEIKQEAHHLYNDEIRKLRNESKLAVAKLDEIKAATAETWQAMTTEMDRLRDAFKHSFHYFKSQV
ncbi:MAG: hypothetical protein KAY82_02775 [Hylemonella sp.]|jgi:regulator of replication initiation timing|nr:hypothetical protein [Hylemonella sp.]